MLVFAVLVARPFEVVRGGWDAGGAPRRASGGDDDGGEGHGHGEGGDNGVEAGLGEGDAELGRVAAGDETTECSSGGDPEDRAGGTEHDGGC